MASRSPAAVRRHCCRARRLVVLRVEADEFRLIDALITAGRLTEDESQRRSRRIN